MSADWDIERNIIDIQNQLHAGRRGFLSLSRELSYFHALRYVINKGNPWR